jgi:hypothetical protein
LFRWRRGEGCQFKRLGDDGWERMESHSIFG